MNPQLFLSPGASLSRQELIGARLDGLVFELGDGFLPADLPESADSRVAAVRSLLPPGYGICGPSAAWVHGYGDPAPIAHHFQRVSVRRQRVTPARDTILHDAVLEEQDAVRVAGVAVTSPLRTMIDLALRHANRPDHALWLQRIASAEPELIAPALADIRARERVPGKRAALAALEDFARAQEEVTRYTS